MRPARSMPSNEGINVDWMDASGAIIVLDTGEVIIAVEDRLLFTSFLYGLTLVSRKKGQNFSKNNMNRDYKAHLDIYHDKLKKICGSRPLKTAWQQKGEKYENRMSAVLPD